MEETHNTFSLPLLVGRGRGGCPITGEAQKSDAYVYQQKRTLLVTI